MAGISIAEVYVMKKLHEKKIVRMEMAKERNEKELIPDFHDEAKASGGCFPTIFKKIHSKVTTATPDSRAKEIKVLHRTS